MMAEQKKVEELFTLDVVTYLKNNLDKIKAYLEQRPTHLSLTAKTLKLEDVERKKEDSNYPPEPIMLTEDGLELFSASSEIFELLLPLISKTITSLKISPQFIPDARVLKALPELEKIELTFGYFSKEELDFFIEESKVRTCIEKSTGFLEQTLAGTKDFVYLGDLGFCASYKGLDLKCPDYSPIFPRAIIRDIEDLETLENLLKRQNIDMSQIERITFNKVNKETGMEEKEYLKCFFDEDKRLKQVIINTDNYDEIISLLNKAKEKNIQIPELILKVQNRTDPRLQELESYLDTYQIKVDYGEPLYASLEDFTAMLASIDYYKDVVSNQNLSPLEQTMMVYDVIKSFVYNESPEDTSNSRYIPQIIKTGNIVCAGYSSLLTQVLQELGIPATSYTVALEPEQDKVVYHARTLIRLDDEKYNIHGIYTLDSTWDSQRKELSTVTSKEGKEEIRYEREEGDTLIKNYDSLALYRNFLVPYRDYRNLYKTDSKPAIFDEVDYDLGLTEKEPYTDTAEEQRQILFPNETKAEEQKLILDTKKPSLEVFTQALRTVRQKEGYLEDSISDQVNDVVELNQMVETLYDRPQTFFPPQTQK